MENLLINHYEVAAVILFGIGFLNLLLQNNLVKKVIGFGIMDNAEIGRASCRERV